MQPQVWRQCVLGALTDQACVQLRCGGPSGLAESNQVASEILALQTSLQASYQTTAMLSQLSLVKFLPVA